MSRMFDPQVRPLGVPRVSAQESEVSWWPRLPAATTRAADWLLAQQHAEGYWVGELEGDTILESEYILLLASLGQHQGASAQAAARYLLQQQQPHGGWSLFPGGPVEVSASVKAYLALRIVGYSADHPALVRGRQAILAAGGIEKINSFTRFYLALLGLIPYDLCPAVPPELILLPTWAPFNIYEMSSWSRTILVPLSLVWALQPVTPLADRIELDELYAGPEKRLPRMMRGVQHEQTTGWIDWCRVFHALDRGWKWCEQQGWKPWRQRALQACEQWIRERLDDSDGLGAIFPPIIWTIVGLRALGYDTDHPLIVSQMHELEKLMIYDGDTLRLQPCLSPVWDTAIALIALRDAGVPADHPAVVRGVEWLLGREVRRYGDWRIRSQPCEPGGWFFEFRNVFYPDVDDTAMVLIALSRCLPEHLRRSWQATILETGPRKYRLMIEGEAGSITAAHHHLIQLPALTEAISRGVQWLLAMQSRRGGWGAFDANNDRELFTRVPFADHNAMIDPCTADITARVLEALACVGWQGDDRPMRRALAFLWRDQLPHGGWLGRWGVNTIYGTWQVLQGLTRLGISPLDPRLQRAADWLERCQQPDGGWGETPASYDDPALQGQGTPTASQTAWALLGLLAASRHHTPAFHRGVQFLLDRQRDDGTWEEPEFTGTGFPRVFYLRYHLYRHYFPLMALARTQQHLSVGNH